MLNDIVKNNVDFLSNLDIHSDNMYVCVFDEKGKRITSYVLKEYNSNADELIQKAEKEYPGMVYQLMNEEDWRQVIDGKIFVNGKIMDAPIIPETQSQIEEKAKREIDAQYTEQRENLSENLLAALLAGNDDAVEAIKQDGADLENWYREELKNIGKEL